MIKRLVMKEGTLPDHCWDGPGNPDELFICKEGIFEIFDLPENVPEIVIYASDKYVKGATKVILHNRDAGIDDDALACFDGQQRRITGELARWAPADTVWFWVEY